MHNRYIKDRSLVIKWQLAYFRIKTGKTLGKFHGKSKIPLQRNGMAAIPKTSFHLYFTFFKRKVSVLENDNDQLTQWSSIIETKWKISYLCPPWNRIFLDQFSLTTLGISEVTYRPPFGRRQIETFTIDYLSTQPGSCLRRAFVVTSTQNHQNHRNIK